MFQEFFRANGATVTLMSGSGSTTFALTKTRPLAESLSEKFKSRFGPYSWIAVARLGEG